MSLGVILKGIKKTGIMKSGIALLLIISSIFLFFCSKSEKTDQPLKEVISVKVTPLITGRANKIFRLSGILQGKQKSRLSFKTGGIIKKLYVDEGDEVQKGRLLASLDKTEISAQFSQAEEAYKKAERDEKRIKKLYIDKVATKEQYENTLTSLNIAKSNVRIAEFNKRYSDITAPFKGRIIKKLADENNITGPGNPVYIIADINKSLILKAGVSAPDIKFLSTGTEAAVKTDAYPGEKFFGKISRIPVSANRTNGLFEIEISIPNPENKLLQGYIAKAEFVVDREEVIHRIPVNALVEADKDRGFIFTAGSDNTAKKHPVIIKEIRGQEIIIEQCLKTGEKIVIEGANYLVDGIEIKVIKE